jgi:monoamine oxidase
MAPDKDVTRRRFVTGTLASGAAAAAVPAAAEARTKRRTKSTGPHTRHADVVIVGAGFAGLAAARNIAAKHRSVIVLEARDRVGGRVWNHELPGGQVSERGGTFIGPTQDYVSALAKELGIGTFNTYDTGDDVYVADGQRSTYSDTGVTGTAPLDPEILVPLATIVEAGLDPMSQSVPIDAPWEAPNAAEWDGQTLESYLKAQPTSNQRFMEVAAAATRPIFGAEPRELSLLFTLFYIAASGDEKNPGTFERNFDTRGGAQQLRFVGGSQRIATTVAEQLGGASRRTGGRVVLGSPVRRIVQGNHGVTVYSDRLTVKAKQVIVAIPPTLAGRIYFDPILPFERDQLTQRYGQGTLTKVAVIYKTPFWREAGLTGTAIATAGPVSATFDDSPPDGSIGIVFGFVGGDYARSYNATAPAARRQQVLKQFATFFGNQALNPTGFFETSWSAQEWTRGCPVGIPSTGTLLAYGNRLREPVGRIHWAGTETSTYWNGYMDGAVRSGERAAAEVLAAL